VAGIHRHPLVRHLGLLVIDDPTFGENPNWEEFTDYAAQILAYERVRLTREPGKDGFDGAAYFKQRVFLLDAWEEMYRGQDRFDGSQIFELLSLPRNPVPNGGRTIDDVNGDADGDSNAQRTARDFVHDLLAKSCVCKLSQGFWQPGMPLAVTSYWNRPELADADSRPGTWGQYLRYGSVHFEQTEEARRDLKPLPIPEEIGEVQTVEMLEPVG
jgi:hypothetical protein